MLPTYFYIYYTPQNLFWQVFFHKNFSDIFPPDYITAFPLKNESKKPATSTPDFSKQPIISSCLELIAGIVSLKSRKKAFVSDGRAQSIE